MATPLLTVHLDRVGSTQDEARARFGGEPLLVTADRQVRGRGRKGSGWLDPPRGVAASLAFSLDWSPSQLPRLTLMAGLAAIAALDDRPRLKWPNDVMLDGRKVGGILTESEEGLVVVGLGVNLYWPDAPDGMGAMFDEDPGPRAARGLGTRWAEGLLNRVVVGPEEWGREEYLKMSATVGSSVEWRSGADGEVVGSGQAVGVTTEGALVVETEAGTQELHSGVVSEIRGV